MMIVAGYVVCFLVSLLSSMELWYSLDVLFVLPDGTPVGDVKIILICLVFMMLAVIVTGKLIRFLNDFKDCKDIKVEDYLPALKAKLVIGYFLQHPCVWLLSLIYKNNNLMSSLFEFGIFRFIGFFLAITLVGLLLGCGKTLFIRIEKKDSESEYDMVAYDKNDPLRARGVNYLKVTDDKLFPGLFAGKEKDHQNTLYSDYVQEARDKARIYFPASSYQNQIFSSSKECDSFQIEQMLSVNHLWDYMNQWLSDRLRSGSVDSIPPDRLLLFTQINTTEKAVLNEEGQQKLAENQAKRAAAKTEMAHYRQALDEGEMAHNVQNFGVLMTNDELVEQGLAADPFGAAKIYRDQKEREKQQDLDRKYAEEILDDNDYDVLSSSEKAEVCLSYFSEMEDSLKSVEVDYSFAKRRSHNVTFFYRLMWPIYAIGHPTTPLRALKDLFRESGRFFLSLTVFIGLLVLSHLFEVHIILSIFLFYIPGFAALIATIFTSIAFFAWLPSFFKQFFGSFRKKSKLRAEARRNAPEVYRQLRYYKLWNANHPAVMRMQKMFDAYLKH